ncbi:coiled-coil-containing protein [Legionella moravica]|uniref:Coiled-coil-containing protein n=1 Tax=Legionella moravica TaxID=39962 RepID=A0A378JVE3_9GAMM|nr:hypothetical protein [Legionella moravica]KTD35537.1 coiled-coil-containing protein [Legionella moravica]STX62685.1 coiled-coil-containing protein [Legionella moravica]
MPKLNDKKFNQKLNELRTVISDINRERYTVGTHNVERLSILTNKFTQLSQYFDQYQLTQEQTRQLRDVKTSYPKEERSPLNQKIRNLMKLKEEAEQKVKVEAEAREIKEHAAREKVQSIFPALRQAAEQVLKANTTTIDQSLESYRLLSADLRRALDLLPVRERATQHRELSSIAEQVNRHIEQIDEQDRQVRNQIALAVTKARETVSKMTIQDMVVSLIGGSSKEELSGLLDNTRMKAITGAGSNAGTLVVADLPKTSQNELIRVLMNQLANTKSSKAGVLGQIVKAMEKDVNALMNGEKTHLSILYGNGKGNVGSVHIDIRDFIRSPQSTLDGIFFHLYKQGLSGEAGLVMSLTSPEEVGALLQLQSFDMNSVPAIEHLEDLTGLVMQNAKNPQSLSKLMNRTITERALSTALSQTLDASKGRPGFKAEEVISFIGTMAVMLEAGRLLVSTPTKQQRELGLEGLTGSMQGAIQYVHVPLSGTPAVTTSIAPMIEPSIQGSADLRIPPVLNEQKQPVEPKIDLSKEQTQFNQLMKDLLAIHAHLDKKFKNGDKKYKSAAELVQFAHRDLTYFGDQFFVEPSKERLVQLTNTINHYTYSLDPVLKMHRGNSFVRGLVATLKGILGVIAALTIVPALVVEATTRKGYAGTFFTTPDTASAKAFKPVQEGLLEQEKEIEAKIKGPQ